MKLETFFRIHPARSKLLFHEKSEQFTITDTLISLIFEMTAYPSIQSEIEALSRRLQMLNEQAENEIRQKLKEARAIVADLEMQLSDLTGRPAASQIKAASGFSPLTDEQLEVQILFVVHKEGAEGINAKTIAGKLNQNPVHIRQWIKDHPERLRREGSGPGTRYYMPEA
ncbi:MAG TPA: hypothetical protein VHY22_03160 [Chthoniobacteraceae bacterium]|jgi:hypothetical protein|nr:hypothetical protein [Chthoniobacteraceae bacterium]